MLSTRSRRVKVYAAPNPRGGAIEDSYTMPSTRTRRVTVYAAPDPRGGAIEDS